MQDQLNLPKCLNRRYEALDNLILALNQRSQRNDAFSRRSSTTDVGLKLLCNFWNILKEYPDFDLPAAVRQCVTEKKSTHKTLVINSEQYHHGVTCYMAKEEQKVNKKCSNKCSKMSNESSETDRNPPAAELNKDDGEHQSQDDEEPLTNVLSTLNKAASVDKSCKTKLKQLLNCEEELQAQIQALEEKEKNGSMLMKQAEHMWQTMESNYKKKLEEIQNRTTDAASKLTELQQSTAKWKKNKKELEAQIFNLGKVQNEIKNNINQKKNDLKYLEKEVQDLNARLEVFTTDTRNFQDVVQRKKENNQAKLQTICYRMEMLKGSLREVQQKKQEKEKDCEMFIRDAREDLQRLQKDLMKRTIDNESLTSQKEELMDEIELLSNACKGVCAYCDGNESEILQEIQKVNEDILNKEKQGKKCAKCTHTEEIKRFCAECPKCLEDKTCAVLENHCEFDPTRQCVCQTVKQRFLENIFLNMETVLSKELRTEFGNKVADSVLACLNKSKNGKLDEPTRKLLKSFVMKNVKKHLMLAIVGGSVKTRCELDDKTYETLISCLTKVKPKEVKLDAQTITRNQMPCKRWGTKNLCNCPKPKKGFFGREVADKSCPCISRAPKPIKDASSCPPPDPEDIVATGAKVLCPHKSDKECGPDCAARTPEPDNCGTEVKPEGQPCKPNPSAIKNMKAVQCMIGTERVVSICHIEKQNTYKTTMGLKPPPAPLNKDKKRNFREKKTHDKNVFVTENGSNLSPDSISLKSYLSPTPSVKNRGIRLKISSSENIFKSPTQSEINNAVKHVKREELQRTRAISKAVSHMTNAKRSPSLSELSVESDIKTAFTSDMNSKSGSLRVNRSRNHNLEKLAKSFESHIQLIAEEVLNVKKYKMM